MKPVRPTLCIPPLTCPKCWWSLPSTVVFGCNRRSEHHHACLPDSKKRGGVSIWRMFFLLNVTPSCFSSGTTTLGKLSWCNVQSCPLPHAFTPLPLLKFSAEWNSCMLGYLDDVFAWHQRAACHSGAQTNCYFVLDLWIFQANLQGEWSAAISLSSPF